jgi:hypothetical protein
VTGAIAGFVLRIAREGVTRGPNTQSGLAEALGVDLATWQGWESGRRPLVNMKAVSLLALRRRLLALGGDAVALGLLDAAMDADRLVSSTLHLSVDEMERHPLAEWVHTRSAAHMLAWALNGTIPPLLARRNSASRRGPVPQAPLLSAQERSLFFSQLRAAADAAPRFGEAGALLHRQALYLCSYDRSAETVHWTARALHSQRDLIAARGWTPRWPAARSTATALVRLGDPQPLADFIDRSIAGDEAGELANLNYWAYWLGAVRDPRATDEFMRDPRAEWEPTRLLRGLVEGIGQAPGYLDLYVHSVATLLAMHPWLPQATPALGLMLRERTSELLDGRETSRRARRDLNGLHYVLRENPPSRPEDHGPWRTTSSNT